MADDVRSARQERPAPGRDPAAERAVLAAVLLDAGGAEAVLARVEAIVTPADFDDPRHAVTYTAMRAIAARREPIDVVTLCAELRARDRLNSVGGAQYVGELTDDIPTLAHCEAHAEIVRDCARIRRTLDECDRLRARIYDGAGHAEVMTGAARVAEAATSTRTASILASVDVDLDEEERRLLDPVKHAALSTGYPSVDAALNGGLGAGDLVILAARPSVGKSALALGIANSVASTQRRVLLFSLEMSGISLAQRLACQRSGFDLAEVRRGVRADRLNDYVRALGTARGLPIQRSEARGLRPSQIRAACLSARASGDPISLVIVDYLQLLQPDRDRDNRAREVGDISGALKTLAGELACPVLALSQLSRKVEDRTSARPRLSDLRESGDLEQDADAVLFLHREKPRVALTVAKQRNGAVTGSDDGGVLLVWDGPCARFLDDATALGRRVAQEQSGFVADDMPPDEGAE